MPELPEVETIARGLAQRVTGDVVESVWLGQKKEPLKSPASEIAATLENSRIVAVRRMGKAQLNQTLSDQQTTAIVAFLKTLTGTYRGHPVTGPSQ